MRSQWKSLLALALVVSALAGCGRGTNSTGPNDPNGDIAGATMGMTASPSLLGDDVYDVTLTTAASAQPTGATAAITPMGFYRWFRSESHHFTFAFADSDSAGRPQSADVTFTRDLYGMINIFQHPDSGAAPDSHNVVHKLIHDQWTRRAHLVRTGTDGAPTAEGHWHVQSASGVLVTSQPGDRSILMVHLTGSGLDATMDDPLQLMTLAQVPHATPNDSVTVTVTPGATDDTVLLYWHDHRERMHSNGDGTFSLKFSVGSAAGMRGIGVNVLSHGTLFDDAAPYNSMCWIMPMWVGTAVPTTWP